MMDNAFFTARNDYVQRNGFSRPQFDYQFPRAIVTARRDEPILSQHIFPDCWAAKRWFSPCPAIAYQTKKITPTERCTANEWR